MLFTQTLALPLILGSQAQCLCRTPSVKYILLRTPHIFSLRIQLFFSLKREIYTVCNYFVYLFTSAVLSSPLESKLYHWCGSE